jgi:hypothetical protein
MKRILASFLLAVTASAQTSDLLTVNVGQQMAFSATAEGTTPFTWQWLKNGVAIAGATNASYTIASAATTDSGTYRARATNSAGSAESNALTINVVVPVVAPKNVVASVVITTPSQGANSGSRPRSPKD